jgi:glycosyltransferase involved in cell wall biosynthesis
MRAVVVIPTYNERDNVMPLLDLIRKHAAEMHVLIVDDNSPDGTGEVAQRASERWPDRVSDLSHDPAALPELLEALKNADLVLSKAATR